MRGRDQKGEVDRWNELKGFSFKAAKSRRGSCLFPVEPPCTIKTCEAHSIQNRTVLDSLAEEGHVVMLRTRRVTRGRPCVPSSNGSAVTRPPPSRGLRATRREAFHPNRPKAVRPRGSRAAVLAGLPLRSSAGTRHPYGDAYPGESS